MDVFFTSSLSDSSTSGCGLNPTESSSEISSLALARRSTEVLPVASTWIGFYPKKSDSLTPTLDL